MATIVNARDVLLQASTRLISDNILSIEEKPSWITAYANILSEQASVDAEATKWGLTSLKTTYDTAVSALTTYLGTLTIPVAWNNLTNITVLSAGSNGGVTFRQKFTDVTTAKAAIYAGVSAIAVTKSITVTASSQLFQISKAGVNSPSSVTFTAQRENLPINPTWSITSGTGTLTSVSGDSAVLTFANMTSDTVTVRALDSGGSGLSDSITVVKVREGVDAVVGYLTNEAHTLPASDTGVVSSYTGAGGTFKVYYGAADVTTSCTFSVQTNTSAVTTSIGAATGVYSITAGIPNGTPVVTVTYRASYTSPLGNVYTIDKTFTVAKSNAGTNGTNGTNGTDALLMSMSASSQVFQISKSNVTTPSSISLTAKRSNVTGANFTVTSGTATLTGISGDNATLTAGNLTTDTATIRVADSTNTYSDTVTIIKVREGVDSLSGILTNDSVTVPASSVGVVSSYSGATGSFIVYYGSANVTTSCTFAVQANPDSLTTSIVGSGASAGQYSVTSGMSSVTQSSVTYRATYTNAFGTVFTVDKIFSLSKSNTGSTGATGVTGAAARIAYGKFTNGFVPSASPSSQTVSGDTLPTAGYWGTQIGVWQTTPFTLSTNESLFQTTGLFDVTANQTVWVEPYLSNLKVGNLAALSVNTGALTVSDTLTINTGAVSGTTMTGSGGQINSNGSFALGNSTGNINYDSTKMTMNGNWWSGSNWKLNQTTNNYLKIGDALGGATLQLTRADSNAAPALNISDTNVAGLDSVAVSNTSTGAAISGTNSNTSGYSGVFTGRFRLLGSSTPISLDSSFGTTGQVLTSAGSSSTPTWGKTLAGDATTSDASGNKTISVTMPTANFGFSACATSGKIVTVTSITNTGGNNYDIVVQTQTSSTGAAAATVGFRWTAIG